ncbi:DNA translocase FtsK [Caloramator sp. E03]|uniref:FtsK/SpoIIIE family DNA translocase n=1 Tax=Caloramator sp. E03 TaxID=2576307 RepID=UPI001110AC6D|nr:DNA translocase FtsK [Caloramator sp. E03]QCX32292.1 DNA translocase FtsK [Caloramator sp. E03]
MARKKNQYSSKGSFNNEIYGIVIVAFSLLIGFSIYIEPSGVAGKILRDFFFGLLGIGAFIFPPIIFIVGIAFIVNKTKFKLRQRFICLCLIIYNLLLTIHLNYSYSYNNLKYMDKLFKAYELGLIKKGGGVISEFIDTPLLYIFDIIGTYIVLICLLLILIILATEISIGNILNTAISKIKRNIPFKNKNQKVNEVITESSISIETENNIHDIDKKKCEENINNLDKKIKILDFIKDSNERSDLDAKSDVKTKFQEDITKEIDKNKIEHKKTEYVFPPIELLNENKNKGNIQDKKELLNNAQILEETLLSFGVEAKVVQVSRGPSVTRYELHPSPGVKVSRIVNLSDDIALNLAAPMVRIEAPIPGKAAVGIEVPNKEVVSVTLREVLESNEFKEFSSKLAFALGKDISGKCMIADLSKMPHLLIAGATGSGKSVCINTLITSLIYKSSPSDVKMLLVDPKVVELSIYNGIPHLLIPVVTEPKKAASALYWAVNEMTQRYKLFAENNVRNIESYNKLMEKNSPELKLPKIVIIIDELADLMMVAPNEVEDAICRLAQMARAAGMHLVIATQRPSVDVITGLIKANIPSRISFAVSSQVDSRTILDMSGAEKLLGKGDMLFLPIGESKPIRIQGAFISEKEVEKVVNFLKDSSNVTYNDEIIEVIENKNDLLNTDEEVDELLPEAIKIAVEYGQVSASMLQRRLRVGFNRASRLVEQMEIRGIVGPQEGSKPRQVLVSKEDIDDNLYGE